MPSGGVTISAELAKSGNFTVTASRCGVHVIAIAGAAVKRVIEIADNNDNMCINPDTPILMDVAIKAPLLDLAIVEGMPEHMLVR